MVWRARLRRVSQTVRGILHAWTLRSSFRTGVEPQPGASSKRDAQAFLNVIRQERKHESGGTGLHKAAIANAA